MLDISELAELEENIRYELDERLEEILIELNRNGKLEDFLHFIGMQRLLQTDESSVIRDGKIIVIGQSEVDKKVLAAVAEKIGIAKERFEFYLEYEDAVKFDFRRIQWSSKYSCILVGPMPHSGNAKGEYESIIAALEHEEGYPPVGRMGTNELKITKSSFRMALENMISERKIE